MDHKTIASVKLTDEDIRSAIVHWIHAETEVRMSPNDVQFYGDSDECLQFDITATVESVHVLREE